MFSHGHRGHPFGAFGITTTSHASYHTRRLQTQTSNASSNELYQFISEKHLFADLDRIKENKHLKYKTFTKGILP